MQIGEKKGAAQLAGGAGHDDSFALKVKCGKSGKLESVSLLHTEQKSADAVASGKSNDTKKSAKASRTATEMTEVKFTSEGLAAIARRVPPENVLAVVHALFRQPGMIEQSRSTAVTDQFAMGLGGDVALGAKVGLNAQASLGRTMRSTEGMAVDTSMFALDLIMDQSIDGLDH